MTSLETRSSRGQARRAELLDELVTLVLAEGFVTLTLDDLARRLCCSTSTHAASLLPNVPAPGSRTGSEPVTCTLGVDASAWSPRA